MDRLQSLEMDALECDAIIENATHSYAPRRKEIKALQYDGSLKMAIAIEEVCYDTWIKWDEDGNFCELRSFTEWDRENGTSSRVNEGDYLVKRLPVGYMLVHKYDFKHDFERVFD
jgi:hypothetical protein